VMLCTAMFMYLGSACMHSTVVRAKGLQYRAPVTQVFLQ